MKHGFFKKPVVFLLNQDNSKSFLLKKLRRVENVMKKPGKTADAVAAEVQQVMQKHKAPRGYHRSQIDALGKPLFHSAAKRHRNKYNQWTQCRKGKGKRHDQIPNQKCKRM
jgi:hypothetical protein